MPSAPWRPCMEVGCPNLVLPGVGGRCALHQAPHRERVEAARGSRIARGYDKDWLRLRSWFLAQPGNQVCRSCASRGVVTRAIEVDHIIPFRGRADPRRLDPKNLQALCVSCHRRKGGRSHVRKRERP
jgi:5-methylcytosine-specific restriction protein A